MLGLDPSVDGLRLLDDGQDFVAFVRVHDLVRVALTPDPVSLTVAANSGNDFVVDGILASDGFLAVGDGRTELGATISPLPSSVTIGFALDEAAQVIDIASSSTIADVGFNVLLQPTEGSPLDVALLVEDVPTSLHLAVDITGAVSYAAAAPVPLLALDAHDPAGLFDRATQLKLRLEDLPLELDVALSAEGSITIDAHGGVLGLMEAQATTEPDERIIDTRDGMLMKDLPDRFVVFARFTDLKSAAVTQNPLPSIVLDSAGGRPLEIALFESAPGKASPIPNQEFTTALLTPAPPQVDLELLPGAPGTLNVAYTASATADSLSFETNGGDRWITSATISNPVPLHFTACQAGDRGCVGAGGANTGSLAVIANQTTTINVFDCVRPLNTNCRRGGSPTEYVDVNNLRTRVFRFAADIQSAGNPIQCAFTPAIRGNTFIDTAGGVATGNIRYVGDQDVSFTLNSGFTASNRSASFSRICVVSNSGSVTASGSIACNNFSFSVRVLIFNLSIKRIFGC
jgi:hypothetical protein